MGGASDELVVPKNEGDFIYHVERNEYINKTTGDRYTGSFKNGQIDGEGNLIKVNEKVRFMGKFENGKIKDGTIFVCSKNPKNDNPWANPCPFTPYFEGSFNDEEKPVTGTLITMEYVGDFYNGKKNGLGVSFLKSKNGKLVKIIYEGNFTDDKRNGKGKVYEVPSRIYSDNINVLNVKQILYMVKKIYMNKKWPPLDVEYNMDTLVPRVTPTAPATPATPIAPATSATPTATNAPATPAATNTPSTKVQGGRRKKTARIHRKMRTHKKRYSRK